MRKSTLSASFRFAAAFALAAFFVTSAQATIPYGGLAGGVPGGLGPGLAKPSVVPGKEYSHDLDHNTVLPGGGLDPEQVIAWDGSGGTADGLDYTGSRPNYQSDDQVDAIANRGDHLFSQVIGSAALPDTAHLVFSHDDEISVYFGGGPPVVGGFTPFDLGPARAGGPFIVSGGAIGGTGEISYEKATAFAPPSTMGVWATQSDINGMPNPDDVDGLEVWGPEPAFKADAEKYSLDVDFFSGVSIWSYDIPTSVSTPYVSHAQIVNAVTTLLGPVPGGAVLPYPTFIDGNDAINLDALMVRDIVDDGAGPDTFDRIPDGQGDRIIFSIRQIMNPNDPDGYYATGSEIFVLDASQPNNPQYLFHGGHLWDQAYALTNLRITPNYIDNGYAVIDVNAIEAISEGVVPEPASSLLLLIASAIAIALRRRG